MQTYRLKNMILIILLLVNLSLLVLIGTNTLQARRAENATLQQLAALYEKNGIALSLRSLPRQTAGEARTVLRDAEREAAFAEALLGKNETQESGSTVAYVSAAGTARFRRNGAVEVSFTAPRFSESACAALLAEYDYAPLTGTLSDSGNGSLTTMQAIDGRVVLGGSLTLTFQNGLLSSLSGYYVHSSQLRSADDDFSPADALSEFLSYCLENGVICKSVTAVEPAWFLSTETLFQSALRSAWLIRTDTSEYYVDYKTRTVVAL